MGEIEILNWDLVYGYVETEDIEVVIVAVPGAEGLGLRQLGRLELLVGVGVG